MRPRWRRHVVCIAVHAAVLAAGCAGDRHVEPRAAPAAAARWARPPGMRAEEGLGAVRRAAGISPGDAEAGIAGALAAFESRRGDEDRLWVVLLTLRAPADEGRSVRALGLMERVSPNQPRFGEDLAGVETLLRALLEARLEALRDTRQLEGSLRAALGRIEHLEAQLKKETANSKVLGDRLVEERRRVERLTADLAQEHGKVDALQEQIQGLKQIEKIIDKREQPGEGEGRR